MQILIEILNPPKRQEIIDIPLHFIDGDICEAGGYEFKVLSPHGRLIDGDEFKSWVDDWYDCTDIGNIVESWIDERPTILEEEK